MSGKNDFMNNAAQGYTPLVPEDDFADLFLDSATGFVPERKLGPGASSAAAELKKSAYKSSGVGTGRIHQTYKEPPNIFKHKAESDAAAEAMNTSGDLRAAFVPNILDNYDAITYHWKLFITDPESSTNSRIMNPRNQTIIAETGITDLTIDKVEIGGVVTPSTESGTGVATSIKFEIVEPGGAALLDKIFYEAISLGIGNWAVMPLYIQLEFRARDYNTSNSLTTEMQDEITSLKWVWAIKLSDIKAHVTHVGTRYEFSAIPYSELAQSNVNFVLQHNVKLENLATFSDAIRELEEKINIDQMVKLTNNYSIPDLYEFHIDPELFNHKISTGNNQDSTRANNMDNLTLKDATFNSGTSIDKVIDNLLSQTEQYQKDLTGAKTPGAEGSPATEIPAMKKFWRVITDARPMRFDPRRQDDAKIFSIYIVRYDLGTAEANVFQQSNSKNYQEVERKRLMTYVNKRILRKKYNYIFTGLNDQIINLDLRLNNAFTLAMARMSGIYTNLGMADKGVVTHNNAEEEQAITAKLTQYLATLNSSKYTSANAKASYDEMQAVIEKSTLDPATKANVQRMLELRRSGSRLETQKKIIASDGVTGPSYTSQSLAAALADTDYRFVSDVDLMDPSTQSRYSDYLESTKGRLRPVARVETAQDKQIGIGLESASNSGIQKLSSMYTAALQGFDNGFIKIQMQIKGDPFWLFPAPVRGDEDRPIYLSLMPPAEAISWIKESHIQKDNTVNFFSTDNFIVIRFRTPRIYSEDDVTKYPDKEAYDEVQLVSGVYRVIRVVSKFENGKFTQDLDCVLDNEIDLRNFVKEIEQTMSVPDIPATVSDLTTPMPDTNTRRARIVSDVESEVEGLVNTASTGIAAAKTIANSLDNRLSEFREAQNQVSNISALIPNSATSQLTRRIF